MSSRQRKLKKEPWMKPIDEPYFVFEVMAIVIVIIAAVALPFIYIPILSLLARNLR